MTETPPPPAHSETTVTGLERSRSSRLLLVGSGSLCLALGAAGVLLPLLPTTPFVLLAAACFSRSSPAFHRALRESRLFGPVLRDWEDHRSIPRAAKVRACSLVIVVFAASMIWVVEGTTVRILVGAIGLGVLIFLLRLPVTPESATGPPAP